MEQEVKIPVMAHYKCPTCGASAVAETGGQLLCQQCVNQFLARNVGMMEEQRPQPVPTAPPAGGFVPGPGDHQMMDSAQLEKERGE
jgi:DNA-directed RNA polymerase subunit RPC12/RpoP